MSWKPEISPDETVLVSCHCRPRRRIEFDLALTDRRFIWSRPTVWSLDGRKTESHPVDEISEVRLSKRRPFFLWFLGLVLLPLPIYLFMEDKLSEDWHASLLLIAGIIALFTVARTGRRLRWSFRGKRFSLATQWAYQRADHDQMVAALSEVHRLLLDGGLRELKKREALFDAVEA